MTLTIREVSMKEKENYAHQVASLAQRAILFEVTTTPKPGLVDRFDSGAHKDMDFFTFLSSSSALYKGLYNCTMAGIEFRDNDYSKLLEKIRPIGIECENDMFLATKNVNTHKGIIFSLGILCAAAGNLYSNNILLISAETLCNKAALMSKNLVAKDFKEIELKKKLTHGELLYKNYGFKGIRGEVESGFKTVIDKTIPIIRNWSFNKDFDKNDLFLEILLNLMAYSEDTNVVSRGGIEALIYVQNASKKFLEAGSMNQSNAKKKLLVMNDKFIEKNISPGGSADLLAVTIFLALMEGIDLY